jgi:hypothetical protein
MEMPEDNRVLLRPSKKGTLGLLLICSAFVAAGVWMASEGEMIGWFASCFFGLGVLVAIVQLLPNSSHLHLTESGLEVRTSYTTALLLAIPLRFACCRRGGRINGSKLLPRK